MSRLVNAPKQLGMEPLRRFSSKFRYVKPVSEQRLGGMVPVIWLSLKCMYSMVETEPRDEGMVPVMKLSKYNNVFSVVELPTKLGIGVRHPLSWNCNFSSFGGNAVADGWKPVIWFWYMKRVIKLVILASVMGMWPSKSFSLRFSVVSRRSEPTAFGTVPLSCLYPMDSPNHNELSNKLLFPSSSPSLDMHDIL